MQVTVRVCPLTHLMSNCCIIKSDNGDVAVVDPGAYNDKLIKALEREGVEKIRYILLTHGHFDHISGADELRKNYGGKIIIHKLDAPCLKNADESRASVFGFSTASFSGDIEVEDGDTVAFGGGEIEVLHTPGHTVGSVCYKIGEHLFTGDTLFNMTVGRTDFPGGSMKEMLNSMKKLKSIDGSFTVYPGHGDLTDLDCEKAYNPYMKGI